MREYKFRAWSPGIIGKRGKWVYEPQMLYDEKSGDCLVWKNQGQNITAMQYTGLKDKNGKEIYEGDIVKGKRFAGRGEQVRFIGEVVFVIGCFKINGVGQYKGILHEDLHGAFEIIGNIYENPEQMEK